MRDKKDWSEGEQLIERERVGEKYSPACNSVICCVQVLTVVSAPALIKSSRNLLSCSTA
jgi:hypothetical protein